MYLDGGVTLFNGSTFHQNIATGYGGALAYVHQCFLGLQQTLALHTGHTTVRSSSLHVDHVTLNGMHVVHPPVLAQVGI